MKIRRVTYNNSKKKFEILTYRGTYKFPYKRLEIRPSSTNLVTDVYVDKELGNEAFTYVLESGDEGSVHIDSVLEYNQDPSYMSDLFLYRLTVEAQKRLEGSSLSKKELSRSLGISEDQLGRLLDGTNYKKSLRQMLALLYLLDYEVDIVVRKRSSVL